jgi:hypothetical protein
LRSSWQHCSAAGAGTQGGRLPQRSHGHPPPGQPRSGPPRRPGRPRVRAARSKAWHGKARPGHGDQDRVGLSLKSSPGSRALGRSVGESLGGDSKWNFTGAKGRNTPPRRARRLDPTLAWASSKANISWRQRAGAMGGGTDASLRWRRIRVITDSCVMAAMMRREPRRQNGQVAINC